MGVETAPKTVSVKPNPWGAINSAAEKMSRFSQQKIKVVNASSEVLVLVKAKSV